MKKRILATTLWLLFWGGVGEAAPLSALPKGTKIETLTTDKAALDKNPVLNFLLGELSVLRTSWDDAAHYYDKLLEENNDSFVIERRIGLDIAQDKLADSLEHGKRLVELDPTDLSSLKILATIYLARKDFVGAAETYSKLIEGFEREGSDQGYLFVLQNLQQNELTVKERITLFKELAKRNPKDPKPAVLTAGMLLDAGEYEAGKRWLDNAITLDETDPKIYALYSFYYWHKGEPQSSITLLKTAYAKYGAATIGYELVKSLVADFQYEEAYRAAKEIVKKPDNSMAIYEYLALMEFALGDYEGAGRTLQRLQNEPDLFLQTALRLFYLSEELGREAELIPLLPSAEKQSPEYVSEYFAHQAKIALDKGDYGLFYQLYDELRALFPNLQSNLYLRQLSMLEAAKEYALLDALLTFVKPMMDEDQQSNITFLEAMSAYGQGDEEGMMRIFKERIKAVPTDAIALNALGFSMIESNPELTEKAFPYLQMANKLMPKQDFIEDSLAWGYYHLEDYKNAYKYMRRAYNKSKHPEMVAHYIVILDAYGKTEEAKELYARYKKFYPHNENLKLIQKRVNWAE